VGCLFIEWVNCRGRGGSWLTCNCAFCLFDLPKKNAPDHASTFFIQAEVRAFFHYLQGVAKLSQKGGIVLVVHLARILSHAGGSHICRQGLGALRSLSIPQKRLRHR
jgi:hypothetical protein